VKDRLGAALGTFCALTPIDDAGAVRDALAALDPEASPFARVPTVHFARFVALAPPERQDARQPAEGPLPTVLMFSAFFDGDAGAFLEALCAALPDEADAVWRSCAGYPGHPRAGAHAFRRWLEAHRVPATAIFGAYPDATVADVRAALAFRERFRAFVAELEAGRREQAAAFATFDAGQRA
jgi:hypothetical protein